jgi:glucose-1-phosphate thymidylyltransferase
MIYYPLQAMAKAGIKDVLLTSSPDHAGHFENLLKTGENFGLRVNFAVQKNPKGGIPQAIALAEDFAKDDGVMVILGDNIFNFDAKKTVAEFSKGGKGAVVFGVRMPTESKQYGVIEIDHAGKVISIEEKPENPKSDIAQTGIYIYDKRVFSFIKKLKPSARGELEVTDLNNQYLKEGSLNCQLIDWWIDAGTSYDELLRANNLVAEKVKKGEL